MQKPRSREASDLPEVTQSSEAELDLDEPSRKGLFSVKCQDQGECSSGVGWGRQVPSLGKAMEGQNAAHLCPDLLCRWNGGLARELQQLGPDYKALCLGWRCQSTKPGVGQGLRWIQGSLDRGGVD